MVRDFRLAGARAGFIVAAHSFIICKSALDLHLCHKAWLLLGTRRGKIGAAEGIRAT
jgi:hypothetical protein